MIIATPIYIKGQARILVSSNLGRKIIKDGIERDLSIDFPGEEVNYTEAEYSDSDYATAGRILMGVEE